MGLSDEQVSTATELPLEEIQKLKEQAWTGLSFQGIRPEGGEAPSPGHRPR